MPNMSSQRSFSTISLSQSVFCLGERLFWAEWKGIILKSHASSTHLICNGQTGGKPQSFQMVYFSPGVILCQQTGTEKTQQLWNANGCSSNRSGHQTCCLLFQFAHRWCCHGVLWHNVIRADCHKELSAALNPGLSSWQRWGNSGLWRGCSICLCLSTAGRLIQIS